MNKEQLELNLLKLKALKCDLLEKILYYKTQIENIGQSIFEIESKIQNCVKQIGELKEEE